MYLLPSQLTWVYALSVILAITMGFATGSNDVANAFGTSVGSGALSLKRALFIASIFEFLGAISLGSRVASTITNGIGDYNCFRSDPSLYMLGMMSSLLSSSIWLIVASFVGMPVSTTHSIIGSIIGMTIALKGAHCVKWGFNGLGQVFLSWVTSPFLACTIAFIVYGTIMKLIFDSKKPFEYSLYALPFLIFSIFIFVEMITLYQLVIELPIWAFLLIILGIPLVLGLLTQFIFVPWLRKSISKLALPAFHMQTTTPKTNSDPDVDKIHLDTLVSLPGDQPQETCITVVDDEKEANSNYLAGENATLPSLTELQLRAHEIDKARKIYWWLQNLTASFASFSHGANDTANAIGPFLAVHVIWLSGSFDPKTPMPFWIVLIGSASIVAGLAILGSRVIKTLGTDLIRVNYVNGFTSELSTSITVVLASRLNIPVSSTHCQVGSLTGTALVSSIRKKFEWTSYKELSVKDYEDLSRFRKILYRLKVINWKVLGNIVLSWLVTLPVSGLISGLVAYVLQFAIRT